MGIFKKLALAAGIILIVIVSVLFIGLYFVSQDLGGTIYLSETPGDNITSEIVEVSEDDFKRYPQLRELFENIDRDGGEFISSVRVQGKAIDEIRSKYSVEDCIEGGHKYKAMYWNGSYYSMLIARS
ncbi:hypothetical protein L0665_05200 [Methanogenium marinum]|uniref:Uncharacterized protein n=1 Tax=Methanogenium marinum TaxID=348610 RepID=A0A9Q4PVW3_9EURY|nr:hypothetical protein [Methanogenium marinum]MDE4908004.1 hypothetical protein [Methanogenium marinum]